MRKTILLLLIFVMFSLMTLQAHAASTVRYGSDGGDVWDLQFRLQVRGFYNQPLDGKFGYHTALAVQNFQREYGLQADRIVGPETWQTLKRHSVNYDELNMLARIVHSEARGESYTGKVAVAAVVMNRLRSPDFPNTIAGVIFQPRAFTAVDDGQYWLEPDASAYAAARDAVMGWDPTDGSLYYFNPDVATSAWIWTRKQTGKIGKHIFAI